MSRLKKISLVLLFVLIGIQFIQPARNTGGQAVQADVTKQFSVPANVAGTLKVACYDCHSNSTAYPWYARIQPVGWLLAQHIKDGKADLNFNAFGSYTKRVQLSKLKAIENSIKDGTMPLASYTMLHAGAKLSNQQQTLIIDWAAKTRDSIEANNQ